MPVEVIAKQPFTHFDIQVMRAVADIAANTPTYEADYERVTLLGVPTGATGVAPVGATVTGVASTTTGVSTTTTGTTVNTPAPVSYPVSGDVNKYPLTMTPVATPGGTVTMGTGPNQIKLLMSNFASPDNVVAVVIDGFTVAGPLDISSGLGEGGGQLFIINGVFPNVLELDIIPQAEGLDGVWINAVTVNLQQYVNNGPATYNHGAANVNAPSLWDSYNQSVKFTKPVPPTQAQLTGTVTTPAIVATAATPIVGATVNGATVAAGTLDALVAQVPANGHLLLPAGTFVGTSGIPVACTIEGAGPGKTILTGAKGGIVPFHEKAGLVPLVKGVTIKGLTVRDYVISGSDGGNAAGVRDDQPGIGVHLIDVETCFNQDGILTSGGDWILENVDAHDDGAGNPGGGATHAVYVAYDNGNTTTVTGGHFKPGVLGTHALKLRSAHNTITGALIESNNLDAQGTNSGSIIDIPDGGDLAVSNSTVRLGAGSGNTLYLQHSEESTRNGTGKTVSFTNVIFDDPGDLGGAITTADPTAKLVLNACAYTGNKPPALVGFTAANTTGALTAAPKAVGA